MTRAQGRKRRSPHTLGFAPPSIESRTAWLRWIAGVGFDLAAGVGFAVCAFAALAGALWAAAALIHLANQSGTAA